MESLPKAITSRGKIRQFLQILRLRFLLIRNNNRCLLRNECSFPISHYSSQFLRSLFLHYKLQRKIQQKPTCIHQPSLENSKLPDGFRHCKEIYALSLVSLRLEC